MTPNELKNLIDKQIKASLEENSHSPADNHAVIGLEAIAKILRVHPSRVEKWIKTYPNFPAVQESRGVYVSSKNQLNRWLDWYVAPKPPAS